MLKLFIFLGLFCGAVFSNVATDNSECIGKANGIFKSSSDCSSFIMCSGGFQTVHKCPEPLLFSSTLLVCDWAQNVKCGQLEGVEEVEVEASGGNASNFDCTDLNSGIYPNPEDCTTFFECSNGDAFIFDCPPGLIFNPTYLICDWPSASNVCHETTRPPVQNTTTTQVTTTTTTSTTTTEVEVPTTELPEEETTQPPPEEDTTQPPVTDVTDDGNSGEETTQSSVTQTEDDGSSEEDDESTTESSSEEDETTEADLTTVRTTTTAEPKFCVGKPNGLYPNPKDCTSFYKCTNEYTYLINCPAGNYFDPEKVGCFDDPSVCEAL